MADSDTRLDVLAFAAHPDDVELCAGGIVCLLTQAGRRVGIVDLTAGELGSRGTTESRREEARRAGEILGLTARDNLGLPDGNIENTERNRLRVIEVVRRYRPKVVLVGAPDCRHPDHRNATRLVVDALFYSGLRQIETTNGGKPQGTHRPNHVLHYMQVIPFEPTLVVDVSEVWAQRQKALTAFRSQFFSAEYEPAEGEPETYVSNEGFFKWVEARARHYGYPIGAEFGEPLLYRQGPVGVSDLSFLLERGRTFK